MLEVFAPKDISSLNKLAGLLVIPFFAAALHTDIGPWITFFDKTLLWGITSNNAWWIFICKALAFFVSIILLALGHEVASQLMSKVPPLNYFLGLTLVAVGVLGLRDTSIGGNQDHLSTFWNLGSLCWGLDIFRIGGREGLPKD